MEAPADSELFNGTSGGGGNLGGELLTKRPNNSWRSNDWGIRLTPGTGVTPSPDEAPSMGSGEGRISASDCWPEAKLVGLGGPTTRVSPPMDA